MQQHTQPCFSSDQTACDIITLDSANARWRSLHMFQWLKVMVYTACEPAAIKHTVYDDM